MFFRNLSLSRKNQQPMFGGHFLSSEKWQFSLDVKQNTNRRKSTKKFAEVSPFQQQQHQLRHGAKSKKIKNKKIRETKKKGTSKGGGYSPRRLKKIIFIRNDSRNRAAVEGKNLEKHQTTNSFPKNQKPFQPTVTSPVKIPSSPGRGILRKISERLVERHSTVRHPQARTHVQWPGRSMQSRTYHLRRRAQPRSVQPGHRRGQSCRHPETEKHHGQSPGRAMPRQKGSNAANTTKKAKAKATRQQPRRPQRQTQSPSPTQLPHQRGRQRRTKHRAPL